MASEGLFQKIMHAEKQLVRDVEAAECTQRELIDSHRKIVRKRARETLEETPKMRESREAIERLQLRMELIRNIKMNWRGFQRSLTRKGMKMRINQHAHLEHLIYFLETGKGLLDDNEKIDPAKDLMTYEVQPTGAGKTGAFAIDVALMDVPSLTLVPFDNLLDQTKKDMMKIGGIPQNQIGIVGGGDKEIGRKHTIATYAGHAAQIRKIGEYSHLIKTKCRLVICDEVHHQALGDQTQESIREIDSFSSGVLTIDELAMLRAEKNVISHLTQQTGVQSLKVAFTATPRGSSKNVEKYFPHFLGRVYHREMVEAGLVVPYTIIQCDGSVYVGELEGYLNEDQEAKILEREGIYRKLAGEYVEVLTAYRKTKHKKRDMPLRGMGFFTNHAECEKFVKEAEQHKLRCRIVTGREAKGRAGQVVISDAVDALSKGEIDLIVTVEKLATGFNREEINAIISGRITSAAKTIQYVGRGGRAFTDEMGRKKKECLVFETNWTLKKNAKRGRKPMRLADALAYNGEDPHAICSMMDGTPVKVVYNLTLDESGTVDINGRMAIGVRAYAVVQESLINEQTLKGYILKAKLKPIEGVRVLGGTRPVDVYWKDEVDPLIPKYLNGQGIVNINGRDAISVNAFTSSKDSTISYSTLSRIIKDKKLKLIKGANVKHGSDLYWKDEIDPFLPQRLNIKGIVNINGRDAIGVRAYCLSLEPPIRPQRLEEQIKVAGLEPVTNVRILGGNTSVDAYWKDEVDPLIPKYLNEQGIVNINGREAIGVHVYSENRKPSIGRQSLLKYIEKAHLQAVSGVSIYSGNRPVDVYWKDEVEDAIKKQR